MPDGAHSQFAIGFDRRDRARLHELWDEVIDSERWSEGELTTPLRGGLGGLERPRLRSRSSGWTGAALAALDFAGVPRRDRALPVEHVHGHAARDRSAPAGEPVFVDCNRDDLCMSFDDFEREGRASTGRGPRCSSTSAATSPSTSSGSPSYCRAERDLPARGLRPRARRRLERPPARHLGRRRASTRSTRPRRSRPARAACSSPRTTSCSSYARAFRNYGKPDHAVAGLNFRMSEFTAAIGLVQTERLEEIVAWKNAVAREQLDPLHPGRVAAARRDDLGPLQVHRLRPDRALDRQGLRPAVPPHHGHRRRPARTATGSPRTTGACRSTTAARSRPEPAASAPATRRPS